MGKNRFIDSGSKSATMPPSHKMGRMYEGANLFTSRNARFAAAFFIMTRSGAGYSASNILKLRQTPSLLFRFGRSITKRFSDYHEAERFLTGLRFENDKGTFDVRDYRKDNPLGFENLANKWIEQKKQSKVKPKTIQSYTNFMNKAIEVWGQRNIKTIGTGEVEDFLLADHRDHELKKEYQTRPATI